MENFFKNAIDAAARGVDNLKVASQRGYELAGNATEEASRKLHGFRFQDTFRDVGKGYGKTEKDPSPAELSAYGITPNFVDFVRSLNYNAFKDAAERYVDEVVDSESLQLNAWELRHATLVVRAVKEIDELRYVLCPRYMDDEHFWRYYFYLSQQHLPSVAKSWKPGDPLPPAPSLAKNENSFMSFPGMEDHFKVLKDKLHSSAAAAAAAVIPGSISASEKKRTDAVSQEWRSSTTQSGANRTPLGSDQPADSDRGAIVGTSNIRSDETDHPASDGNHGSSLLGIDPDLEAYLKDVESAKDDDNRSNGEDSEDDLNSYLNELEGNDDDGQAKGNESTGEGVEDSDLEGLLNELSSPLEDS